ncbi:carboxymethylenebutenolidase-related protein [Lachnospiraceae bacterium KM106-2]|nr:carboxymethylenebutenolidase-related protein [Lachnospiraceae bacterium KM106-2]
MNRKKIVKGVGIGLLVIVAALMVYGVYWINDTYKPMAEAKEAMVGDGEVTVTNDTYITFKPKKDTDTGFIFYPGGLVEPESYAPLCRAIAEEGYLVVIVPMKLNLAILSADRADGVIKEYPEIKNWAIGGHSLGGVMAAQYASKHEEIKGVALYAAYPQGDQLQTSKAKIMSVYGSKDGVADLTKVKSASLPKGSEWLVIQGGNHCYFGDYGMQKGDNKAEVSRTVQQTKAVAATVALLKAIK